MRTRVYEQELEDGTMVAEIIAPTSQELGDLLSEWSRGRDFSTHLPPRKLEDGNWITVVSVS